MYGIFWWWYMDYRSHILSGMHIQEGTRLYIFCINRAVLPSSQGFSFQWGTQALHVGYRIHQFLAKACGKNHPTCTPKPPNMHSQSIKVHWNNKRHDKIMQAHYQVTKNSTWLWKLYHTPSFCPNKILWTSRSCGKYSMNHLGDFGDHFAFSQSNGYLPKKGDAFIMITSFILHYPYHYSII